MELVQQGATPQAAMPAKARETTGETYGPQATKLILAQPLNPLVKLKFETLPRTAARQGGVNE